MARRITAFLLAPALSLLLLPRAFPPLAAFCRIHLTRPLTAFIASGIARVPFPMAGWFAATAASAIAVLALLAPAHRRAAQWLAALLAGLLLAYTAVWGVLYACPTGSAKAMSPETLRLLCERLTDEADDALSRAAPEDDFGRLCERGRDLMRAWTGLPLTRPKAASRPALFTALGLAGLYFPFTGEAIVNPEDCPDTLPFTICHELAHQAGVTREGEANYCAFLACEAGGDASFRYSACFTTLLYAMKALRSIDRIGWLKALSRMSPALYSRFIRANGLASEQPVGARAAQQIVSDAFLRLSGDREGIASYERVLPLLAAHWRLDSEAPI